MYIGLEGVSAIIMLLFCGYYIFYRELERKNQKIYRMESDLTAYKQSIEKDKQLLDDYYETIDSLSNKIAAFERHEKSGYILTSQNYLSEIPVLSASEYIKQNAEQEESTPIEIVSILVCSYFYNNKIQHIEVDMKKYKNSTTYLSSRVACGHEADCECSYEENYY